MQVLATFEENVDILPRNIRNAIEKYLDLSDFIVEDGVLKEWELTNYHRNDYAFVTCKQQDQTKIQLIEAVRLVFNTLEKRGL